MGLSDIERSKNTPPDYHQGEPAQALECPECGNIWREEMTCTWEEDGARWAECGRCYHDFYSPRALIYTEGTRYQEDPTPYLIGDALRINRHHIDLGALDDPFGALLLNPAMCDILDHIKPKLSRWDKIKNLFRRNRDGNRERFALYDVRRN